MMKNPSLHKVEREIFDDRLRAGLQASTTVEVLAHSSETRLRSRIHALETQLAAEQQRFAQRDRSVELGRMASHLAHEIRKGLLPIGRQVKQLESSGSIAKNANAENTNAGREEISRCIQAEVAALETTVNDLISYISDPRPCPRLVGVRELVEETLEQCQDAMRSQGVRATIDVPGGETVLADPELLRRSIRNLTLNAIDAMPSGGEIVATSYCGKDWYELEIADSGEGVEGDLRQQTFAPFYSTKGKGLGLGLTVVAQIAAAHGGEVDVLNCPEGGAAYTLRFPSRAAAAKAAA